MCGCAPQKEDAATRQRCKLSELSSSLWRDICASVHDPLHLCFGVHPLRRACATWFLYCPLISVLFLPLLLNPSFFFALLLLSTLGERRKEAGVAAMALAASSPLLYSRYSECVPLIDPVNRPSRASYEDHRNDGGAIKQYDDADDENVAFLSSVQTPSELCLALACVARRREALRSSERGPLLVFVPFHEPRDEVFVEVPVAAFGDAGRRRRGLQLLPLNDYSSLCADARDGLPPRRGFFVTFRTRAAQQRFRAAMHQNIRGCAQCGPLDGGLAVPRAMGPPTDAAEHRTRDMGSVQRGGERDGRAAATTSHRLVAQPKPASEARGATSFIDSLLAERDRRRAEYIAGIQASPPGETRQGGGIEFNTWSRQQQSLHPELWNVIDGAIARQAEAEWRVGHPRDASPSSHQNPLPPPLAEREALLRELRTAVEMYDNMSDAQGSGEMSLMGAARQFLRQHQNHLWQLQHAAGAPPYQSAVAVCQDDPKTHPPVLSAAATAQSPLTVNRSSEEALQPRHTDAPEQREPQDPLQQTLPSPPPLMQQSALGPEEAEAEAEEGRRLQEELQRAREIESRILSSSHAASPSLLASKGVFGRAPKTSWLPSASLGVDAGKEEVAKEAHGGAEKGGSVNAEFETAAVTSSLAQVEVQPAGATSKAVADAPKKEAEAKFRQCGAGWRSVLDPASGKTYYVHVATKKTTWNVEDTFKGEPQETGVGEVAACGAEWRAVADPSSGRTYYVHRKTKATTWKLEDTLREDGGTSSATLTSSQQPEKKQQLTEWAERKDPATGKVYYYNKKTKQTTWKRAETDLDPL
ncbi:uncharacterized protein Tco025E_00170 [Trypanosoma conorhini]|uniref:WW domain-containing protein n=1 Tax=Trypanosoma conorhini TaxID=83891 RepID=A0A422QCE3_9TRYP|nr:uncharacterized protein Tco025E_00170 [Trypanosoma conorhini]RNF27609.1 hypothetical protein Tco025E_00170 [Trypanosoma conorhini]